MNIVVSLEPEELFLIAELVKAHATREQGRENLLRKLTSKKKNYWDFRKRTECKKEKTSE